MKARRLQTRRGVALALVMIHATLMVSAWVLANRQMVDMVHLQDIAARREQQRGAEAYRRVAQRLALGYGLALLNTGPVPVEPDQDAFECLVDVESEQADGTVATTTYRLRFRGASGEGPPPADGDPLAWEITAEATDEAYADRSDPEVQALYRTTFAVLE